MYDCIYNPASRSYSIDSEDQTVMITLPVAPLLDFAIRHSALAHNSRSHRFRDYLHQTMRNVYEYDMADRNFEQEAR